MKVGEVIAGRYELEELVGTGGMSRVYRAHDRLLERDVALKILHDQHGSDEETVERFRREARAVAQLSHPNIVTVIDRGEEGGRQFIVFEYVPGEDLKTLVQRGGPLPVRRGLQLVLQIARALAFAHGHGLVHRDVKPQNVIVTEGGTAKVTDFGIARSRAVESMTQTGTLMGTSAYVSPEQATGSPVDERTDVYSLGVVLYELLTGELPFEGDSFLAVAMRHVAEPAPSVLERRPQVPARVATLVEQCLEKEPGKRFSSMDELIAGLEDCLADLGSDGDRDATAILPSGVVRESPRRLAQPRRSRRVPLLVLLGLVLLAVLAGVLLLRDDSGGGSSDGGTEPARLRAIASHDPEGGDGEHDELVERATDGNPATYWATEEYQDFASAKSGVGLLLDAGRTVELSRLALVTTTPGFTARIDAGDSPDGDFRAVSGEQEVSARTSFALDGAKARYYVVWITALPEGVARIGEVTASS
ncbi:MAG: serine/threonine protein kinase [Actinobacteria bacterium]|nr:serine/threonine protein kinase [Actinomycetota bacterium]